MKWWNEFGVKQPQEALRQHNLRSPPPKKKKKKIRQMNAILVGNIVAKILCLFLQTIRTLNLFRMLVPPLTFTGHIWRYKESVTSSLMKWEDICMQT